MDNLPDTIEAEVVGEADDVQRGHYRYVRFMDAPPLHRCVATMNVRGFQRDVIATHNQISPANVERILSHPPIKEWMDATIAISEDARANLLQRWTDQLEQAIDNVADALKSPNPKIRDAATRDYLDRFPTGAFIKRRRMEHVPVSDKVDSGAIAALKNNYRKLVEEEATDANADPGK